MTENDKEKNKRRLWYVRRNGQVKGPYPSGSVRRFLLLGRVRMEDQVSQDQKHWQTVADVPEVIPPEVRKALAEGDAEQLIVPRMREDERNGRERRVHADDEVYRQRRKGERRQAELEIMQQHREAKTDLMERRQKRPLPLAGIVVTGALVLLAIGFGFYLGAPPVIPDPDCNAQPAPGVNWRNCKLDGVVLEGVNLDGALINNGQMRRARLSGSQINRGELSYLDLSEADLSYTELKQAALKGATLRAADLSYADLSGADLSFADLTGAKLGGAKLEQVRLDNAIWIGGEQCLAGSLGGCRVPR
ncbi:MAG: pentapeptide repeat-containing protein [Sedimenticola sp.]|nr:pentapeptide repeat-containing protein [Sedimenticola sp.]